MDTSNAEGKVPDPKPDNTEPFPKEIRLTYDTKPINDLTDAIDKHKNAQQVRNNSDDCIGKRQATAQENATRIAKISMFVSCALGGFTIVALILNAWAVHEATRAADAADSTVSIYKATFRWDSFRNAQASDSESVRFQKQFNLNKNSADSQIRTMQGTLAETKKEFEIENKPLVEFADAGRLGQLSPKYPGRDTATIVFRNFGKMTAKITSYKSTMIIEKDNFTDRIDSKYYDEIKNRYLPSSQPLGLPVQSQINFPDAEVTGMVNGTLFLYFVGEIEYQDMGTGLKYRYSFRIQRNGPNINGAIFRQNDTSPITKSKRRK